MHEVTIPLRRVQDSEVANADDYMKIIQDEYASRYLELCGIASTPANKAAVMRFKPLEDCEIHGIWAEDRRTSAVADAIRIVPPLRTRIGDFDGEEDERGKWEHWYGHADKICIEPPDVHGRSIFLDEDDEDENQPRQALEKRVQKGQGTTANAEMKMPARTEVEDLAAELNRVRQGRNAQTAKQKGADNRQAGHFGIGGRVDTEQREIFRQELTSLKHKFILPFACERPGEDGQLFIYPWPAAGPLDLEVPKQFVEEAAHPIDVSMEDVQKTTNNWVNDQLPLELLTRRRDPTELEHVRESLKHPDVARLIGLLAHLLYWLTLGTNKAPGDVRLSQSARQTMFVTINQLWSRFERHHRLSNLGVNLVLPCLMLTIKQGIERCFAIQYPSLTDDETMNQKVIDRINGMLMRLFDPDGQYARFGKGDCAGKAISLSKQLERMASPHGSASQVTRKVGRRNRCTPLVRTLLGSAQGDSTAPSSARQSHVCDARTRAILHVSDKLSTVGANVLPDDRQPPLAHDRQPALAQVAIERVTRKVGTGPGASNTAGSQNTTPRATTMASAGGKVIGRLNAAYV